MLIWLMLILGSGACVPAHSWPNGTHLMPNRTGTLGADGPPCQSTVITKTKPLGICDDDTLVIVGNRVVTDTKASHTTLSTRATSRMGSAVPTSTARVKFETQVDIDDDKDTSPFASYCLTVEALEGIVDIVLTATVALNALDRQEYWQASFGALAVLSKALKALNMIVNFVSDAEKSKVVWTYGTTAPSQVHEAHASLAVFAPTRPTTIYTLISHIPVASDTHGAVIASQAGAAPTQGSNRTYVTPSYTVHRAIYI